MSMLCRRGLIAHKHGVMEEKEEAWGPLIEEPGGRKEEEKDFPLKRIVHFNSKKNGVNLIQSNQEIK